MIYLATYNRKTALPSPFSRKLLFIETKDRLALDKVIALVKKLTAGDFEESSVEIIGEKSWDASRIRHPGIRFYRVD
jgi:hypothetical protein